MAVHILPFVPISPESQQKMTDGFRPAGHLLFACVTCAACPFADEMSRSLQQAWEMQELVSPQGAKDLCPSLICRQEMVALCFLGQE